MDALPHDDDNPAPIRHGSIFSPSHACTCSATSQAEPAKSRLDEPDGPPLRRWSDLGCRRSLARSSVPAVWLVQCCRAGPASAGLQGPSAAICAVWWSPLPYRRLSPADGASPAPRGLVPGHPRCLDRLIEPRCHMPASAGSPLPAPPGSPLLAISAGSARLRRLWSGSILDAG